MSDVKKLEESSNKIKDQSSIIRVMISAMQKSTNFVIHFDSQTNILIGIGTAVFAFSISQINDHPNTYAFYVLSFFSAISVIISLYAIHPPKVMRKRGQVESLLYNKRVIGFDSANDYSEEMIRIMNDEEEVVKQFSIEIYNVYKYYYRPKRKLFKIARNFLVFGLILGSSLFFFG